MKILMKKTLIKKILIKKIKRLIEYKKNYSRMPKIKAD